MKKIYKKILTLLTAGILTCSMGFHGNAAETFDGVLKPDPTKLGSITITLKDSSTGTRIPDGSFLVYQIADLKPRQFLGYDVEYTTEFLPYTTIEAKDILDRSAEASADLETFVMDNGILSGVPAAVGSNGQAYLDNLKIGLYLVTQDQAASGYRPIRSFIVSVPLQLHDVIRGDYLEYDVDATPKAGTVSRIPTPPYGGGNGGGEGGGGEGGTPPPPKTTPDTESKEKILKVLDAFDEDGNPPQIQVLAQTGQLWWPVPVLAVAGLLIFSVGWIKSRSDK